jgi:hypothetical protein
VAPYGHVEVSYKTDGFLVIVVAVDVDVVAAVAAAGGQEVEAELITTVELH